MSDKPLTYTEQIESAKALLEVWEATDKQLQIFRDKLMEVGARPGSQIGEFYLEPLDKLRNRCNHKGNLQGEIDKKIQELLLSAYSLGYVELKPHEHD